MIIDNLKLFNKGEGGRRNTSRRPKGSRNLSTLIRDHLNDESLVTYILDCVNGYIEF